MYNCIEDEMCLENSGGSDIVGNESPCFDSIHQFDFVLCCCCLWPDISLSFSLSPNSGLNHWQYLTCIFVTMCSAPYNSQRSVSIFYCSHFIYELEMCVSFFRIFASSLSFFFFQFSFLKRFVLLRADWLLRFIFLYPVASFVWCYFHSINDSIVLFSFSLCPYFFSFFCLLSQAEPLFCIFSNRFHVSYRLHSAFFSSPRLDVFFSQLECTMSGHIAYEIDSSTRISSLHLKLFPFYLSSHLFFCCSHSHALPHHLQCDSVW